MSATTKTKKRAKNGKKAFQVPPSPASRDVSARWDGNDWICKYRYMTTDLGNAERLADICENQARYVDVWRRWLVWDEHRWAFDKRRAIDRLASASIRSLYDVSKVLADPDGAALRQWAAKCEDSRKINAMIALSRSRVNLAGHPDDFDQRPTLLNTPSGVVDLETQKLLGSDPSLYLMKATNVPYIESARAPRFERFLREVFKGDEETVDYVQRRVGGALLGRNGQSLDVWRGDGANGKSTLMGAFDRTFGSYVANVSPSAFTAKERNDDGKNHQLAGLKGARLVMTSEPAEDRVLDEALVKLLTGGDMIRARFLFSEFFEYRPEFTIVYVTNHLPVVRGTDWAIWRRLRLVTFGETFKLDDAVQREVWDERAGILAWAVRGVKAYLERGLEPSSVVARDTEQWRIEADPIAEWLDECCVLDPPASTSVTALYQSYQVWAATKGRHALSDRNFGVALSRHGIGPRSTVGGEKHRPGIRLRIPGERPRHLESVVEAPA
jgi:putative DNA primase/helicase